MVLITCMSYRRRVAAIFCTVVTPALVNCIRQLSETKHNTRFKCVVVKSLKTTRKNKYCGSQIHNLLFFSSKPIGQMHVSRIKPLLIYAGISHVSVHYMSEVFFIGYGKSNQKTDLFVYCALYKGHSHKSAY